MNKKAEKYIQSLVKKNYEEIADSFNESRKKSMKEMVSKITESLNIKKEDKILDLGCGNGRFLEVLEKDSDYLGLDNSTKLIEHAKKNYEKEFEVLDILELEKLKKDDFDYIFSWATFHHIPGKRLRKKFLEDVYRKTSEKGAFVLSVWKLRKRKDFFSLSLKTFLKNFFQARILDWGDLIFAWKGEGKVSLRYYHAFSRKSLKKEIKNSSFKTEKFLEDSFNYYIILRK
jgi:cyclopropane fatty-acyl-phospholipid synthase-like methyltransferase